MEVNKFFDLEEKDLINFDFSEDILKRKRLNTKYQKLREEYLNKDTPTFRKYILYKKTFNKSDPDVNNGLLKDILKELWKDDCLKICECTSTNNNCIYHSDTMTSVQGLINAFYIQAYNEDIKEKDITICTLDDMVKMYENPAKYPIFEKYFIDNNDESKIIKNFIKSYHTLGNYIPVPPGFNMARSGNFSSHDMWDITLMKIKEYYDSVVKIKRTSKEESLLELLHYKDTVYFTQKWLDYFGSWENFVDENFLKKEIINGIEYDNYVDENYNLNTFFENIHNFSNPKIQTKDEYLEYLKKVTSIINNRTVILKHNYNENK